MRLALLALCAMVVGTTGSLGLPPEPAAPASPFGFCAGAVDAACFHLHQVGDFPYVFFCNVYLGAGSLHLDPCTHVLVP